MKIYKTYNKVREIFKRPRVKFWCGLYKNCPYFNIYQSRWIRIKESEFKAHYWFRIPDWLNISFKSTDVVYKHKFQYTYLEYPPHVVLYLFGFLFLWVLDAPNGNTDDYWESVGAYLEDSDIQSVDDKMGTTIRVKEGVSSRRHRLSCDFLKEPAATYIVIKRWNEQTNKQ